MHKAFAGQSADGQRRLEQDLISLINDFNSSGDSTMVVPVQGGVRRGRYRQEVMGIYRSHPPGGK